MFGYDSRMPSGIETLFVMMFGRSHQPTPPPKQTIGKPPKNATQVQELEHSEQLARFNP